MYVMSIDLILTVTALGVINLQHAPRVLPTVDLLTVCPSHGGGFNAGEGHGGAAVGHLLLEILDYATAETVLYVAGLDNDGGMLEVEVESPDWQLADVGKL